MKKKESFMQQIRRENRENRDKFTASVTDSKDYENLYDIGAAIRSLDTSSLIVGALMVVTGLIVWIFAVLWPFLRTFTFHMGFGGAVGVMLIMCGIAFYIGSFRILHPLSKAVGVAKDRVIRNILAEKEGSDGPREDEQNSEETD